MTIALVELKVAEGATLNLMSSAGQGVISTNWEIINNGTMNVANVAIQGSEDLIKNNGDLTLGQNALVKSVVNEWAIYVDSDGRLLMKDDAKIEVSAVNESYPARGVFAWGEVEIQGSASISANGHYAEGIRIGEGANLVLKDSSKIKASGSKKVYGIYMQGDATVTMENGTISAVGNSAEVACGIYNKGKVNVKGGSITVSGAENSCGILNEKHTYAIGGQADISGGTIDVTASKNAYAIIKNGETNYPDDVNIAEGVIIKGLIHIYLDNDPIEEIFR